MVTLSNLIAVNKHQHEKIEITKNKLMSESDELTTNKKNKTTEHGQLLMTIENMHRKVLSVKGFPQQNVEFTAPKNFDNMQLSADYANLQLQQIHKLVNSFNQLRGVLDTKQTIKDTKQKMKDNYEIV